MFNYINRIFFGMSIVSYQSEAALEDEFIKYLETLDYTFIDIHDEYDLLENLKVQLEKLNNMEFTDNEFNSIFLYLNEGTVYKKAEKLRDKYELQREDGTVAYVEFLDKHWCKNSFQVTHQITVYGTYENRYDVTLLINGLPLVQVELKRRGVELKQAFNQIERYRKHSYKNLFGYIQIFVITNGVDTKYFANNKDINYKYTFFWKDFQNNNITNLRDFTEQFLDRFHLHKMITKYMVLTRSTQTVTILRAYQYYAVERILDKALHSRENGYIWHTTGSGKTLTSFKASQILAEQKDIDKVIFIVDRRDLDNQTLEEFNKFGNNSIDGTTHTRKLIRQLNGTDKLIVTTIQKLSNAVKQESKLEKVRDKKIILMFDECHRSQFGQMHSSIINYFTNIQYYGFTGTPILAENRTQNNKTTHDIFGECLHKYLIVDAIGDENVLGFSVDYVGRFMNKLKQDVPVEQINTKEYMESSERIEKIVDYIIKIHNIKTYNKEFTSILAVSSIDALNKYYDLFKQKDHDLKIATIYTFDPNAELNDKGEHPRDKLEEEIRDYNKMFGTNYSTETFQNYYQDVSKKSKDKKIDILLVVNMFLTGFDNKYLNTLYVDKNLEYHNLLQAYSRTNRLCNEKKAYGNIVCFRPNLKEKTDEAIQLFSNEHALEKVLTKPYKAFVNDFNETLKMLDETIENISELDSNTDVEKQAEFVKIFRELLRIENKLKTFTEFKYEDLNIPQQEFEDYKSKYLDLKKEAQNPSAKDSILNDIDFETELLRSDDINVSYILNLLKDLDPQTPGFEKDRDFILEVMQKDEELRSKVELINKFIQQNMIEPQENIDTEEKLEEFMDEEKDKEIRQLATDEDLKEEPLRDVIQEYEFSGKEPKSRAFMDMFNRKIGLKERRQKTAIITQKIKDIISTFAW